MLRSQAPGTRTDSGIRKEGGMMAEPNTDYEALVLALTLAITAPTEEKAQECARMGEDIAQRLTPEEVEAAKVEAQQSISKN